MTVPRPTPRSARRLLAGAVVALVAAGCTQGGLTPHGPEASRTLTVIWALTIGGTAVTLLVVALWWIGIRRPPGGEPDADLTEDTDDARLSRRFVVGGGIVLPAVVLAVFFGVQLVSTVAQPAHDTGDFELVVTGHQYWWEVAYRGVDGVEDFETANQVHVPTGTPVTVVLRSEDVIHSFWVPELAGKVDMVPGREHRFVLEADDPGTYTGWCAEYCGLQHTRMLFEVVAMPPGEFATWAQGHAAPAREPTAEAQRRGQAVFEGQSCVGCHTIRGVAEEGQVGPDLTHLATRDELGAGTVPLREDTLRAWIANVQAIKPGARMPPQELTEQELDDLVAYLTSLE